MQGWAMALIAAGLVGMAAPPPAMAQTGGRLRRARVAQSPYEIPKPEPLITLKGERMTISRALRAVFRQTPYKYRLSARVGLVFVNIDVKKQPLSKVLQFVLSADRDSKSPLVWKLNKDTLTILRENITMGVNQDDEKVITLSNARIGPVLAKLFTLMKVKYRIAPDLPPILVSLSMRPRKWADALPDLMDRAYQTDRRITFSLVKGTYIVHVQRTPVGLSATGRVIRGASRLVTVVGEDMPLREALAKIFDGSKWKVEVDEEVKDTPVTVTADRRPELSVLRSVLQQVAAVSAPVTYREEGTTLHIEPGPLPGQARLYAQIQDTGELRTTSLNVTQQRLRDVVDLLAQSTGAKITVAKNVPDIRVSFRVQNKTIQEALRALIASGRATVPTLGYRMVDPRTFEIALGSKN